MKTLTILVLSFALPVLSVSAQESPPPPEAMTALGFLEGTWKGEGWIAGPGGRMELASTELVESKVNGHAVLIEGIHRDGTAPGFEGDVIFEAMALLTYDPESESYDWRSATSHGRGGNFKAELTDENTLQWGREGSFRYIIRIDDGRWHEIGETTRDDGETWRQFFEMTLEKVE